MDIQQNIALPETPMPIVIIGAGGIVRDAHLPAYSKAGFEVLGVYDKDKAKAVVLKNDFDQVQQVYRSLPELVIDAKKRQAVYDIAVPANFICDILEEIPDGSPVLIQKPMGETFEEAERILELCRKKNLVSGINFQLRYAPYIVAARDMIEQGLIGEVYDMELMVCVYTPWHLWDFLFKVPRMEILYHSIHYLDLVRSFLGNPEKVYASTIKLPKMVELAQTRSTIILDYPRHVQARVLTNHGHEFGLEKQQSYLKFEGTEGAIKIRIGVSMDYPRGLPPKFEYILLNEEPKKWKEIELEGGWFPDAFIGPMAGLQRHCQDRNIPLPHSAEDALDTMRLVEAAYISSEKGGVKFSSVE